VISQYDGIVFDCQFGKQNFSGIGVTHNWVKQNIFWKFFYWKTNLLGHNLDVIHIKKNNVFKSIFNMAMDVKGKTKDNMKARMDISLFYHRKNMELIYDESRVAKLKTSFVLYKNAQLPVYKWFKSLCFLNGLKYSRN
jgi:hypothetical protein